MVSWIPSPADRTSQHWQRVRLHNTVLRIASGCFGKNTLFNQSLQLLWFAQFCFKFSCCCAAKKKNYVKKRFYMIGTSRSSLLLLNIQTYLRKLCFWHISDNVFNLRAICFYWYAARRKLVKWVAKYNCLRYFWVICWHVFWAKILVLKSRCYFLLQLPEWPFSQKSAIQVNILVLSFTFPYNCNVCLCWFSFV